MQIYKSKKIWHPQASPGYAPVDILKIVIDIYLPSYRFWRSTLIDLGSPRKKLCGHQNYPPPPPICIFWSLSKKIWGPPSQFFWGPPQRFAPPWKNSCGRPWSQGVPRIWQGGPRIFFSDLEICMSRSFARGFGGMPPTRKFFKMVQFGAFWCIFGSDFVFKKYQKLPFFI